VEFGDGSGRGVRVPQVHDDAGVLGKGSDGEFALGSDHDLRAEGARGRLEVLGSIGGGGQQQEDARHASMMAQAGCSGGREVFFAHRPRRAIRAGPAPVTSPEWARGLALWRAPMDEGGFIVRKTGFIVLVVALVASLLAALAPVGAGAHGGKRGHHLRAKLVGETEVPPGDPDGTGVARVHVRPQRGSVCFTLRWADITPPTAAHIHIGRPGVAGPVVVPFFATSESPDQPPTLPATLTGVSGCSHDVVTEGTPFDSPTRLLMNLVRHPRRYYVNVHTVDFPAGAIRGQLRAVHH
jgi:hypothetical protein